jgi:LacI family transcriptional regulator
MTVTIKDIARAANVSFSTVSKALNGSARVKDSTRQKILQIAQQMGYHPNLMARHLVSKKSNTIGVVWPNVNRAAWSDLVTIISHKLKDRGYHALISINPINSSIEMFGRLLVDAVLVFCPVTGEKIEPSPHVPQLFYGTTQIPGHPVLNINRSLSIFKAVEYLYRMGHRRITYICCPPGRDPNQEDKYNGFVRALHQFNLPQGEEAFSFSDDFNWEDGCRAMEAVLRRGADGFPTAVVCGSCELTIGVLRAIRRSGLRVPDDISVIGYDNIPQMGSLEIPVTAVGVPVQVMADNITECLLAVLKEPQTCFYRTLDDVQIVERGSTRAICPEA